MPRKLFLCVVALSVWLSGCAGQVTTATEPDYVPISDTELAPEDGALAAQLAQIDPEPADRIALAMAIEGLQADELPDPQGTPQEEYEVGARREFWTHNSDTLEFTRITAELMVVSDHAYFWQDVASTPLNANGEPASLEDWSAAAESFDASYERIRAVFGSEESPGLDGDARLFVINSESLGRVGGYFGQADQLPSQVEPHSNEGQYFFVSNLWSSGIASEYYKEVLAHEYQHMVHKRVDPNEDGWMNEGLSMLAQQVAGMRGHNFVADYLSKPDQSLWYWSGESQDYGQSYLYLDYLYEQLGEDFIRTLVADSSNGLNSIDAALDRAGYQRDADVMYADAITAAFFDAPDIAEGRYNFEKPELTPIKPRYEFTALPAVYQGTVQQYGGVDVVTFTGDGAVKLTFTGDQRARLIPAEPHGGDMFWWSGRNDSTFSTLTREIDLSGVTAASLTYWTWYDIEEDWDYAYVLISIDNGAHWSIVPATSSRETDPNNQNLGHGLTGRSGGGEEAVWIQESADLSRYAGQRILLQFAMQNDLTVNEFGFAVDDVSIPEIGWSDDMEGDGAGWTSDGFVLSHNFVPQVWRVRTVGEGENGELNVRDVEVAAGAGSLEIGLADVHRLVVFIFGQTRNTNLPASYQLEVR